MDKNTDGLNRQILLKDSFKNIFIEHTYVVDNKVTSH